MDHPRPDPRRPRRRRDRAVRAGPRRRRLRDERTGDHPAAADRAPGARRRPDPRSRRRREPRPGEPGHRDQRGDRRGDRGPTHHPRPGTPRDPPRHVGDHRRTLRHPRRGRAHPPRHDRCDPGEGEPLGQAVPPVDRCGSRRGDDAAARRADVVVPARADGSTAPDPPPVGDGDRGPLRTARRGRGAAVPADPSRVPRAEEPDRLHHARRSDPRHPRRHRHPDDHVQGSARERRAPHQPRRLLRGRAQRCSSA